MRTTGFITEFHVSLSQGK